MNILIQNFQNPYCFPLKMRGFENRYIHSNGWYTLFFYLSLASFKKWTIICEYLQVHTTNFPTWFFHQQLSFVIFEILPQMIAKSWIMTKKLRQLLWKKYGISMLSSSRLNLVRIHQGDLSWMLKESEDNITRFLNALISQRFGHCASCSLECKLLYIEFEMETMCSIFMNALSFFFTKNVLSLLLIFFFFCSNKMWEMLTSVLKTLFNDFK